MGFRWSARVQALRLHLSGWVRNLPDGDLETHVEGRTESIDDYLEWLGKGPPCARVEGVEAHPTEPRGYISFDIDD